MRYEKGAKDAKSFSRVAANKKVPIIVTVGGDGSVNEGAEGMIGFQSILAVLSTGSGNGCVRYFNMPKDPKKAIELLNSHNTCWVGTVTINQSPHQEYELIVDGVAHAKKYF